MGRHSARCLCPTAVALVLSTIAAGAAPEWLESSFRRAVIGADPQNTDRMIAQIDEVADCGADTAIITGHLNGRAFLPSGLATVADNLAVPDVLEEGVRRIHARGMRAFIYVGAPLMQASVADRPEWRQRKADGSPVEPPTICIMSPGHAFVVDYLCEMARRAPLDGLWLDGYPQGAQNCFCPECAEAYRADTGLELPTTGDANAPELRRYVTWWHGKCAERTQELVEAVHAVRAEIAVFANCATGRSADDWRFGADAVCRALDGPSVEQFWHVDGQGDPLNALFAVSRLASAAERDWVESYVPLLPHTVDCTTVLPEVEMLARNFTIIAAGGVPQSTYGPGRQELYTRLMAQIAAREPYLRGARRARYAGIAASETTALQYGRADAEAAYWHEVKGWLRALTEAHLPVELLSDHQLETGAFHGLQCIVLPSTACLSPPACEELRAFVQAGGGLVAAGPASLADGEGEPLPEFLLADVFGAHYARTEKREPLPAFFTLTPGDHPLGKGQWVRDSLWQQWICLGHALDAVGLPGTCVRFTADEGRLQAWRHTDGESAIIAGQFGAGRVAYCGLETGAAYYEDSYPYLRSMMAESVLWAAPAPPRDLVDAPLMVQATYFEQPTDAGPRRVIHLLNEVSSFGRASLPKGALPLREEVIPVPGVRVRVAAPAGRIHLEPGGVDLKPGPEEDGSLTVELPPLGLHQMVVVEGG